MEIGIMVRYFPGTNIEEELEKAAKMEFTCCQLVCWHTELYTKENAEKIKEASKKTNVKITALWAGWDGPKEWNFYSGPSTLGLVPPAYRFSRLKELFAASNFIEMLGITDLITHVGFLPETPTDPDFIGTVTALRSLATEMEKKGQYFLFETGQETPITMLRAFEEIGTKNLGVNLDMANLILYGKASPVDAILILGKYIRNVHCKDGDYPITGKFLGEEKPLGKGMVNIPLVIKKLKDAGYKGPLVIENELENENQIKDIANSRDLLKDILSSFDNAQS